ncbi:HDOD domain-containing protein [Chitinibacter fontanus]|uniref:HDOD domain-containing protein n=1 Tax=Chitinibacter fontanus TaxID=1737446 RepID=A0A7D5V793_9NEIS|nr:HDOD domain-containing protein [Chitinibacter fontanus]QLI80075.1 HDOD domain-containing protein [Chitinibacter fontanus]
MAHVASGNQHWLSKPLPILQSSRNHIIGMVRRADRIKPAEIAEVVLQDPLLAAQLLRVVNHRNKTSLSADISSIESAILLIGVVPFLDRFARHQTIESIMLPAMQQEYSVLLKWLFHAQLLRRLAKDFATQRYDSKVDVVQVSALISPLDQILALLNKASNLALSDSTSDTLKLFQAWDYPTAILDLLSVMAEPTPRYALHKALVSLMSSLDKGWWQPEIPAYLQTIALILGQEVGDVWRTVTKFMLRLTHQLGDQSAFYSSARWLAMQPGDWPVPHVVVAKPEATPVVIGKDVLVERMQALHLAGMQGAPTNQVMSLAIKAIADGLGMQRIAFALFIAAENSLRSRYVQGRDADGLRQLILPLEEMHLFTRLLQKPSSIWLNSGNASQYQALLPSEFREQVQTDSFCAMSIFVGDKPLGILYADVGDQAQVSDYQYQHFKQISTLTSRALAHNARRKLAI